MLPTGRRFLVSWDDPFFYPHTVTVRDLLSSGGMGEAHGTARSLRAEVKDEQRLVLTDDGSEVVSSSTVSVSLTAAVRPGSFVTVWGGTPAERESVVLAVGRNENEPDLDSFLILYLK